MLYDGLLKVIILKGKVYKLSTFLVTKKFNWIKSLNKVCNICRIYTGRSEEFLQGSDTGWQADSSWISKQTCNVCKWRCCTGSAQRQIR